MDRQDKLDWGGETTAEVPLSKALNPHLLWWGGSVDQTAVALGSFQVYMCGPVLVGVGQDMHWKTLY